MNKHMKIMRKEIENKNKTEGVEEEIKKIITQLPDGSVFCVKDKNKLSALKMKLKVDELSIEEFISIFIKKVEKHWDKRTVPTKFPFDISWEKDLWGEIFDKYHNKFEHEKEKEIKEKVGKFIYITGRANFERAVKEKNLEAVEDGVAVYTKDSHDPDKLLSEGKRIITWNSKMGEKYRKILDKFFKLVKKEADKEFAKRKEEAKNRFKNQSKLAEEVFYQYIRPYLIGIILSKATKGKLGSIVTSENELSASVSFVKEDNLINEKFEKPKKKIKGEEK